MQAAIEVFAASPGLTDPHGYDELDPFIYDLMEREYPDLDYWTAFCGDAGPVLELACGTGRVLRRIPCDERAKYGIDLSRSMLAAARAAMPQAHLVEGDIASHVVARGHFARIFIAYNSLYHVLASAQLATLFDAVRTQLRRDGLFGIDIFNPFAPANAARLANSGRIELGTFTDERTGQSFAVSSESTVDLTRQIIDQVREFRPARGAPFIQRRRLRFFSPQEIVAALDHAGLRLVHTYGDYRRRPMTITSGQMLLVAAHA